MAAGTISNLGAAGTSLNDDLIDKLRSADEKILLKPLEKNADKLIKQKEDYFQLSTHLKELNDSFSIFAEDLTYLKRTVTSSGDGGSVSVSAGVSVQEGSIEINALAKNSIEQSNGFKNEDSFVTLENDKSIKIEIDGKSYEITVPAGMKLVDVMQSINDETEGKVKASILNVGGDKPFSLVLKSAKSGSDNQITVTDKDNILGFNTIQKAQDASFTFNGINVTRSTNSVDDLINGVVFNLQKADSRIDFKINENFDDFADSMEGFVSAFNSTMGFIDDISNYDPDATEAGSFFGESRITGIRSGIIDKLFDKTVNEQNITEYGLELDKSGKLIFDKDKFSTTMSKNQDKLEEFFNGKTNVTAAELYGNKVGYTNEPDEIRDGYTIKGKEIPIATDITIPTGSLKINGVSIREITLLAANTPAKNAQLVLSAINKFKDETGVIASVSKNGEQIILKNESGGELKVISNDEATKYFGIDTTSKKGSREYASGIFSDISDYFKDISSGNTAPLELLKSDLDKKGKSIEEDEKKITERLDARYETMRLQFVQYNSLIKGFESGFSGMQMQIDAMVAKK